MVRSIDDVLDVALQSCEAAVRLGVGAVKINESKIQDVAAQLDRDAVRSALRPHVFPIRFDDKESEVTFLVLYHLLDFGSGFDRMLLEKNQRGAHETIQFGVLGMWLSGKTVDRHFMSSFTLFHVGNYFGIEHMVEQEVAPGILMSKPGPLAELTHSIQQVMAESGRLLGELGHQSLGALVLALLRDQTSSRERPSAAAFVEQLAEALPGFQDSPPCGEQTVVLLRKAQGLAASLHLRFAEEDPLFSFSDLGRLCADSGAVLPAVLRHKGVLDYGQELAAKVDDHQQLPAGTQEVTIRAAAVLAADRLARASNGAFTALQLGAYMCDLTEAGGELHGQLTCHLTPGVLTY